MKGRCIQTLSAFLAHAPVQEQLVGCTSKQEHGRGKAGVCTCRDCSARSMYSMVSSRAQKAGTAPWRTMEEQDEGSTSARNVSARAASSIMSGLCSEFSRCTCTGAMPVLRDSSSPALGMQKCLDAPACQISCSSLKVNHELLLYCLSI